MKFIYDAVVSLLRKSPLLSSLEIDEVSGIRLSNNPKKVIKDVIGATGEVSSLVYSEHFLKLYQGLSLEKRISLLKHLLSEYDLDTTELQLAITEYTDNPTADGMAQISNFSEPKWQTLFRRLNATADGSVRMVRLREDILNSRRDHPDLSRLDVSIHELFVTLFNPGYLVLQPIDWSTPAEILEKIIAYEAVHEIESWDALRARLAPKDRRCFAFFHLAMPDEPLIFVEVALTDGIPSTIDEVLKQDREHLDENQVTTAVFYSISNCQRGLVGVSFGNFLLKQVIQELQDEIPSLDTYVTLSPVPGFARWLSEHQPDLSAQLSKDSWIDDHKKYRDKIAESMSRYILVSDRKDLSANDPVARFHLGNGASVHKLNHMGDTSVNGIKQSAGMMINYLYDLKDIEENHESYSRNKEIKSSAAVKKLLKS